MKNFRKLNKIKIFLNYFFLHIDFKKNLAIKKLMLIIYKIKE